MSAFCKSGCEMCARVLSRCVSLIDSVRLLNDYIQLKIQFFNKPLIPNKPTFDCRLCQSVIQTQSHEAKHCKHIQTHTRTHKHKHTHYTRNKRNTERVRESIPVIDVYVFGSFCEECAALYTCVATPPRQCVELLYVYWIHVRVTRMHTHTLAHTHPQSQTLWSN